MVRQSCHGGRWETIRYALDSDARTIRFCLIWVVLVTSSILACRDRRSWRLRHSSCSSCTPRPGSLYPSDRYHRGSPRAYRAWPLAWPMPLGPLGCRGLQRSRVGPEDRFCEAVRNDLRVPLTLEGPARTMRGVPAPSLWHLHDSWRIWRVVVGLAMVLAGAAAGYGGDRRRPVTGGAVRGSSPRRRACVRRTRRKLPPRNGETSRLNPGRYDGSPWSLIPSTARAHPHCSRPRPSGPARRRCALKP